MNVQDEVKFWKHNNKLLIFVSRNWQYKDVYRWTIENQHRILRSYNYLGVYKVSFIYWVKILFLIDPVLLFY